MAPILLTREQFKQCVFERSKGRCVACGQMAVDAHHIMERKLFEDGGYYLDNGAAVCNTCHLLCEYTTMSVEQVRQYAGIETIILPPLLDPVGIYDKWGNRIWGSGMRTAGPLAQDTGTRRALAAGGFLGLLMPEGYLE